MNLILIKNRAPFTNSKVLYSNKLACGFVPDVAAAEILCCAANNDIHGIKSQSIGTYQLEHKSLVIFAHE